MWAVSKILQEGYSGYSDLAVTPDRDILCLYEGDSTSRLVLARFNVEWLTDGGDHLHEKDR